MGASLRLQHPLPAESHALEKMYPRIPDASSAEIAESWALPGQFRLHVLLAAGVHACLPGLSDNSATRRGNSSRRRCRRVC
jgi:hypothetical protein